MANNTENNKANGSGEKSGSKQIVPLISVNAQYVKDLSFENPKSPASLMPGKEKPKIDVTVDLKAATLQQDVYEVILKLSAESKIENEKIFIAELSYAGVFTIKNVPEQEIEPALLIFCPTMIFPFARRILSDVVRDGGFPPLYLDPIDFSQLYRNKKGARVN